MPLGLLDWQRRRECYLLLQYRLGAAPHLEISGVIGGFCYCSALHLTGAVTTDEVSF